MQEYGGSNARGLNIKCPFVVRPKPLFGCPHRFNLSSSYGDDGSHALKLATTLSRHALTRACLPFPKDTPSAFFVSSEGYDNATDAMMGITRINGGNLLKPAWAVSPRKILAESTATNLVPYCIYGASVKWTAVNNRYLEPFRNSVRPLIILGDSDCVIPSWVTRVEDVDFAAMSKDLTQWETKGHGDHIIKAWMREEWTPSETIN